MTISSYDPQLKTRIMCGQTQTVYMQIFTGHSFYVAIFRSHDKPGMVYVESGFAQWHFHDGEQTEPMTEDRLL